MMQNGLPPISEHLPDFKKACVFIVCDLMLDRYWYGDTSRISPEAPVPVVLIENKDVRAGGAANVALNVASLTAQAVLFGIVGKDQEAQLLEQICEQQQVQCHFQMSQFHPTITKLRVMGRNQQLLRMDFECIDTNKNDVAAVFAQMHQSFSKANVLLLSDYAKGTLQNIEVFIELANQYQIPVLIDPKAKDFSRYRGATLVTQNYKEFIAAVGACSNHEEIVEKALQLIKKSGIKALLITLGKDGMLLVASDQDPIHYPARAKDVYDVTGAGDTVIATIAASLGAGVDLAHAVHYANVAE